MDSREVCLRILRANSEKEVDVIIESVSELQDSANWRPLDGRETNFNVVTNQAATGSKALTELCTNMVDAVLMKHAQRKGINLRGSDAPQSVIEGVRQLVELKGAKRGILAEVDDAAYLREFAEENLVIGVTGGTRREEAICFTFVDNGEGQHPEDFKNTFLSLSKGNKSDIPFVQGKYNMGSSGVLNYCGRRWYKLIISRRWDSKGDWGWTLVRRRPIEGMPIAEYFMLGGRIPTFQVPELSPLLLQSGEVDSKVTINTGTVVKLYQYHMESAASFRYIRESINENLVSTILPFRLMDYRYSADPRRGGRRALGVDERSLYGMEFLLLRYEDTPQDDEQFDLGDQQDIGEISHPELGKISVRAIVLKPKLPGWLKMNRRVFHAVNGQVQFKQTRGYLSQQCKLPGLKDRVIIIVDASELLESAHNDIWKGDRETTRDTPIGQMYINEVTNIIRSSDYLKQLERRIAQEELAGLAERGQVDLFQSLLDNDRSIAQLLPAGEVVTLTRRAVPTPEPRVYQGRYSPTFVNVAARSIRENGAEIAINGKRVVGFVTDVVNDYFTRSDNRGQLVLTNGASNKFSYHRTLRDGMLTLEFEANSSNLAIGEVVDFSVSLHDDAIPEPVIAGLRLKVTAQRQVQPPGPRTRRKNRDEGEGDAATAAALGLPRTQWMTENGRDISGYPTRKWDEGFTDQDGGLVGELSDDERVYYINYDNAHFRSFLDKERDSTQKRVLTEQYRMGMLVLMLGFEDAYARMEEGDAKSTLVDSIDEIRRLAARGAATVVMSIAKTLPSIVTSSSVTDAEDE